MQPTEPTSTEPGLAGTPEKKVPEFTALVAEADSSSRQRSTSPWNFTVSTKAINRVVRSHDGSGVSTPVTGQRYLRVASSGAPASRASYENAVLAAVRKQIDSFEEKVGTQIHRMQQHNDKLRDAAFTRLEEKVNLTEGFQPKAERRIAELTGNFKGLSDEMSAQIRRVDVVDEKIWEFKHQMEKELRHKIQDIEKQVLTVASNSKAWYVSLEDTQKKHNLRLHRVEDDAAARVGLQEGTHEALKNLHSRLEDHGSRLEAVEAHRTVLDVPLPELTLGRNETREEADNNSTLLSLLDRRLGDVSEKVETLMQNSMQLHSDSKWHEEQLKTSRTLLEEQKEKLRALMERERERSDLDGKFDLMRKQLDEHTTSKDEKLELFEKKIEHQEQACDELRSRHEQMLQLHGSLRELQILETEPMQFDNTLNSGTEIPASQECSNRIVDTEVRLKSVEEEVMRMASNCELHEKVGGLINQLRELVPKFIEMDERTLETNADLDGLAQIVNDLKVRLDTPPADLVREHVFESRFKELHQEVTENQRKLDELTALSILSQADAGSSMSIEAVAAETSSLKAQVEECCRKQEASEGSIIQGVSEEIRANGQSMRRELLTEVEKSIGTLQLAVESLEEECNRKAVADEKDKFGRLNGFDAGPEKVTRPQVEKMINEFGKTMRNDLFDEIVARNAALAIHAGNTDPEAARLAQETRTEVHTLSTRVGEVAKVVDFVQAEHQGRKEELENERLLLDNIDEVCRNITAVDNAIIKFVPYFDQFSSLAGRFEEKLTR